jgi:hypothetical protein
MITKSYKNILDAWHGLTQTIMYSRGIKPIKWGICCGYPDIVEADIKNLLDDAGATLGMASFTKSRWTRFLRRYFRPDLPAWVERSVQKLTKYPARPFVCSYDLSHNVEDAAGRQGHNYGGCLSSLQIRIFPVPSVILYSRACMLDKIGLLDLALMHHVSRVLKESLEKRGRKTPVVKGTWVISLGFISGVSQIYYTYRFKLTLKGHILEKRVRDRANDVTSNFGPLKRLIKRRAQLKEFGEIPNSCAIKDLSLDFELAETK